MDLADGSGSLRLRCERCAVISIEQCQSMLSAISGIGQQTVVLCSRTQYHLSLTSNADIKESPREKPHQQPGDDLRRISGPRLDTDPSNKLRVLPKGSASIVYACSHHAANLNKSIQAFTSCQGSPMQPLGHHRWTSDDCHITFLLRGSVMR